MYPRRIKKLRTFLLAALFAASCFPTSAVAQLQSRPTTEQALDRIADFLYSKQSAWDLSRRVSRSVDDWPSSVGLFVRAERDRTPILDRPGLTDPEWIVLTVTRRGEFLQYLEHTQTVQFVNPLGHEPDGSGVWYKVRLLDGREGWLLARPSASAAAPFAILMRREVPRNTLTENLIVTGGILFWVGLLSFWFLRSRRKKALRRSVSPDTIGTDTSTSSHAEERAVSPGAGRTTRGELETSSQMALRGGPMLVTCRACRKKISHTAKRCPRCGDQGSGATFNHAGFSSVEIYSAVMGNPSVQCPQCREGTIRVEKFRSDPPGQLRWTGECFSCGAYFCFEYWWGKFYAW